LGDYPINYFLIFGQTIRVYQPWHECLPPRIGFENLFENRQSSFQFTGHYQSLRM